jgi:hypothetical protein
MPQLPGARAAHDTFPSECACREADANKPDREPPVGSGSRESARAVPVRSETRDAQAVHRERTVPRSRRAERCRAPQAGPATPIGQRNR